MNASRLWTIALGAMLITSGGCGDGRELVPGPVFPNPSPFEAWSSDVSNLVITFDSEVPSGTPITVAFRAGIYEVQTYPFPVSRVDLSVTDLEAASPPAVTVGNVAYSAETLNNSLVRSTDGACIRPQYQYRARPSQ
jgi:hypothetical protein